MGIVKFLPDWFPSSATLFLLKRKGGATKIVINNRFYGKYRYLPDIEKSMK